MGNFECIRFGYNGYMLFLDVIPSDLSIWRFVRFGVLFIHACSVLILSVMAKSYYGFLFANIGIPIILSPHNTAVGRFRMLVDALISLKTEWVGYIPKLICGVPKT